MNTREYNGPLTNKHLRWMAWAAFIAAVGLAAWGVASDSVVAAFLTKAAADLGLVQSRNAVETVVEGKGGKDSSVPVEAGDI